VASDIPIHGQYIDSASLKSQGYLDPINIWTERKLMQISEEEKRQNA
jgi:hypothetical protein